MRARFIVVSAVICQQVAKVAFSEHHDMVEAFASDRSNQPFHMTVLPWRAGRDWSVSDAHGSQPTCHHDTIRSVAVTDEVARCRVPRECFGYLSGDPLGGRCCGHIGSDEAPPVQTKDDQPVEKF